MSKNLTAWSKIVLSLFVLIYQQTIMAQSTFSLQEAIRTGLERNSKIKSNDKVLEAMQLRVEAARRSQIPSVSLGYSAGISRYNGQINDIENRSMSRHTGSNASLNWNLFDGGAKKHKIESLECQFKERQAAFNSTNALIPNTQGQIASSIVSNYISLSAYRTNLEFTLNLLETLKIIEKAARTDAEISEVKNYIASMLQSAEQQKADIESTAANFKYLVTLPAPDRLYSLEEMIQSITIPSLASDAYQIAVQKSPSIKSARYQLECSRLRYKSSRASAYSPKVDLHVGAQVGNRSYETYSQSNSHSHSASATITVRINLDPSSSSELKAQSKEIEASQDSLDAAMQDTEHELNQSYPELNNTIRFIEFYKNTLATGQANVQKYIDNIQAGKPVNSSDAIKEVSTYVNNWYSTQGHQIRLLNIKFQIQKEIGTLFESLGLSDDGVSRFSQTN